MMNVECLFSHQIRQKRQHRGGSLGAAPAGQSSASAGYVPGLPLPLPGLIKRFYGQVALKDDFLWIECDFTMTSNKKTYY
jgi:hypothetical protein